MTPYHLGEKSLRNLRGVHPHLVACVMLAITESEQDFSVREGVRTLERQQYLKDTGASWTLNSDHLARVSTEPHAVGHAVDLYPFDRHDREAWQSVNRCRVIIGAMMHAAERLGVPIYSGGVEWQKDFYHFGLKSPRY